MTGLCGFRHATKADILTAPAIAPARGGDAEWLDEHTKYHINPTGNFVIGGPMGDTGLTGRKIIVDTYGGIGPSRRRRLLRQGPDQGRPLRCLHGPLHRQEHRRRRPRRPRRSPARLRHRRRRARQRRIDTFGTGKVGEAKLTELVRKNFSLTPKGIIESLNLRRPIYQKTAAYGHFGRSEPEFTWEATDKAAALAEQAGLVASAK